MPFLIDGHNLIPHLPGLSLGDLDDEIKLIQQLQAFSSRKRTHVEVYFDRAPAANAGKRRYGRVTAVFVREGGTADDAIRRRLKALGKQAKNWTTVSDDREVQASARNAQSSVLPSTKFASLIHSGQEQFQTSPSGKQSPILSNEELKDWMKFFSNRRKTN